MDSYRPVVTSIILKLFDQVARRISTSEFEMTRCVSLSAGRHHYRIWSPKQLTFPRSTRLLYLLLICPVSQTTECRRRRAEMPSYDNADEDVFGGSGSQFLSPSATSPRRSPSRQSMNARNASPSFASNMAHNSESNSANGQHSLAHELAVALMPEPSAGSKLLAEEFGIEYDEGAEGIDEEGEAGPHDLESNKPSFADELGPQTVDASFGSGPPSSIEEPADYGPTFGSPVSTRKQQRQPEKDAMDVLAQNLESTDKFLAHLRRLDVDSTSSSSQPSLEKLASEVIRRLNETARDRESQLRELLGYERELRKIGGEVGGTEVLGQLDGLDDLDDLADTGPEPRSDHAKLDSVTEEPTTPSRHISNEWEMDPDQQRLGDEDNDFDSDSPSPVKDAFPPPPPINGPMTTSKTIPQLTHIRTFTASLVSSLTTISEQAQVNGAATTEAGRKIRALKNKIGGWRTDWDGAERSRLRIERWEAGLVEGDAPAGTSTPSRASRRVDGRTLVQEHLQAFEKALTEAGQRTQAIMAAA